MDFFFVYLVRSEAMRLEALVLNCNFNLGCFYSQRCFYKKYNQSNEENTVYGMKLINASNFNNFIPDVNYLVYANHFSLTLARC